MFSSSKTKHKEVWEVGAEVQRLIVDRCSYKCLHNPVWERIKNVAIHYHKTHLNFSLKCCNSRHFEVFVKIFCVNLVSSLGGVLLGYYHLDGILSKSSLHQLKHTLCSQWHLAHVKCEYYQVLECEYSEQLNLFQNFVKKVG